MDRETKFSGCVVVLAFAALALVTIAGAYMEARAYERVTGAKVSTWDAMFLDLRVQEEAKQ